ncbi:MAG: hypothetical protein J0I04_08125 [Paenarthrobacter ureafaciens]|uniref:hypothetical protein n=1 Tax=Paenarthrobacter ureafaciens TaxID=37931 RepID=UPI001AC33074|nr:hypothetical protein [Paenarthrobacter ureafaciens]MBN9129600.1 hypothetical protein [Paenarthrobacter ureafaciens]
MSSKRGPQMLHRMYHWDPAGALEATRRLERVQANVILPGHGPALHMPVSEALKTLRG